ncbi:MULTISPECIES: LPS O-antigen chain length determinant protein WzzB [Rodentibacter]|uniref:LPS O-antigen chain length determinant protein WzzB n=1 Tax=Rodentibacter TaxID=1960084 RepID=UPI001CFE2389|nr:Wzz/FepE/Etk N-terminal domain-containing protein [Rodentibacter sp. JRC1]GJI55367.1 hypothetical protein HEMROJRC1_04790 [Rodentibacter sp. JRC1]
MNHTGTTTNDEIDLIELIKVLWNKKIWIILSAFIFTAIAGVYAFTAQEKWTSKAEVIAPQLVDFGDYFSIRKEYGRIVGEELKASDLKTNLFDQFVRLAASADVKQRFFLESELYKQLSSEQDERGARQTLAKLVNEETVISKPDTKKEPNAIAHRLSLSSAPTADLAQNTLQGFIHNINEAAFKLEKENFLINFEQKIAALRYEAQKISQNLTIQKDISLENLTQAYDIAKQAGIHQFSQPTGNGIAIPTLALTDTKVPLSDSKLNDSSYLFMLGEKYLKAQIDTISAKEIIYPPRYYQIQEQLKELEPLYEKAKSVKANTFTYQASPDYPVVRDKPNKVLILIIGFIFGMLISVFYILIQAFYKMIFKNR